MNGLTRLGDTCADIKVSTPESVQTNCHFIRQVLVMEIMGQYFRYKRRVIEPKHCGLSCQHRLAVGYYSDW